MFLLDYNHELEAFAIKLMQEKGFIDMIDDQEILASLQSDLVLFMQDRISTMVIDEISSKKTNPPSIEELEQSIKRTERLEKLITAGDQESHDQFIKENIPDLAEKLQQVLADFRHEYLADTGRQI